MADFMKKTFTGDTIEDAITQASMVLRLTSDKLGYEVIDKGAKGFLGLGARKVMIEAWDKEAEAEALKVEKQAFEKRQKTCENRAESLKQWLAAALNGERFKTTKCDISFRTAKSVNVTDVFALESRFLKFSDPTADKTAIKKAIEAGEQVSGAELIERKSVTIK